MSCCTIHPSKSILLSLNLPGADGICLHHPAISRIPTRPARRTIKSSRIHCSNSPETPNQQPQLNLSVLRFTLGIPGLDESYLPRWLGYGFGSLLILNHFAASDSSFATPAQLRTEALGLSLAAFSVILPYLGKFLKGATPVGQAIVPEGAKQIFVMSQNISDALKEDLAWASYILLRNTSTISVLILFKDALCVRGYWNLAEDASKVEVLNWFKEQIESIGITKTNDILYFPQTKDSELWDMLPKGTRSLMVQPIIESSNEISKSFGFVLLASSTSYAYSDKDRAWIAAIANKFKGKDLVLNL